ncbi:MAG: Ig-like domain-containing protein, partial [Actinomycetota bacterium]
TIQASIGALQSNIVEMTWLPLNAPPVAVDDAGATFSGTPVTVNVLANDGDPDFDLLTITAVTQGANGSVVNNGDGTVTYTPNLGFAGIDTFTYTISDGKGGTDTATVTITVTKRTASVTAGGGTKVYGAADPTLTPSSAGFLPADSIVVTQTARDAGEDVGSYATHATATGAALVNYDVTYNDGALTITPAATTTVVTCPTSVMYTSAAHNVCTANVTGSGGLNQAVTPVSHTNHTNVGTANASATYAGDANHTGSTGTASFAVTPAPLSVVANSFTRSYLAADPVLTGTLAGVLGADGITATYSSTGIGSQVPGVYATVPTLVDPNGKLGNYAVSSTNGTLTITNAAPVCTIAPSQASIWPPNHKLVSITASGATDID